MKDLQWIIFAAGLAIAMSGCVKEDLPNNKVKNLRNLSVPTGFTWSNSSQSQLTVNLIGAEGLVTEGRMLQLLDDRGLVISKALVSGNKAVFRSEIPSRVERLALFFPMTRTRLEFTYSSGKRSVDLNVKTGEPMKNGGANLKTGSPDCMDGCTRTESGNLTSLTVKAGETVCLTGTLNGGLSIKANATLKICGTANITWSDLSNTRNIKIIVTQSGSITSSNFYMNGADHKLYNWGTINLNNWFDTKGIFENYGNATVKGMEVFAGKTFTNFGTLISNGEINVTGTILNHGSIDITGAYGLNLKNEGIMENNCQVKVGRNMNASDKSELTNNGYFRVEQWIYFSTTKTVMMGEGSMFSATNVYMNAPFKSESGVAAFKIEGTTNIDSKSTFSGSIDICDETGIDGVWGVTLGENITYCEAYIPVDGCNPEGMGTPAVKDSDGDGIVDDEDEFPEDPTRAFTSTEPYNGYKIWAFEDLWPNTGDYDFNDLVIATKIRYALDANQRPVDAQIEVIVRGMGAGLENGLGLQFLADKYPARSFIAKIEGENSSVDDGVVNGVLLTSDIKKSLSPFYNNNGVGPSADPQTWTYQVEFSPELLEKNPGLRADFFIFRTSSRDHEVHVAGAPATALANAKLFGTGDDYTNPGENYWYKTMNGIPWGITLLTEDINWAHPIEKISILKAYPAFEGWATSGGQENPEWFRKGVFEYCFHVK